LETLRTMRRLSIFLLSGLMLLLAAAGQAGAEAPSPNPPKATDARLAGDAKRTRLIVDLSGPVDEHAFLLADPYRVVVDLPQIDFTFAPTVGQTARGLVTAFRFGLIAPGRSRIVIDLADAATIDRAFLLDAEDGQPARLVIDLVKADRTSFLAAIAAQSRPAEPPQPAGKASPGGASNRSVVVIDPGHGGIDTGAVSSKGEAEKTIVLAFARSLAAKLDASGRYKSVLTRDDDTFVSLAGRIAIARANEAALFISIHADTLPDPFGVRGATIYTLSDTASDAATARYAEKENRADLIAGVDLSAEPNDVADILIDLARRETKSFSGQFARLLVNQLREASTLNKNPHRSAGFMVLKAPDVPSVLLELGYLSNSQDTKLMLSDPWRERATSAVMLAIDEFFRNRPRDARATSE
jgi:N-acetylmuramoyl-L-alanine amidase